MSAARKPKKKMLDAIERWCWAEQICTWRQFKELAAKKKPWFLAWVRDPEAKSNRKAAVCKRLRRIEAAMLEDMCDAFVLPEYPSVDEDLLFDDDDF